MDKKDLYEKVEKAFNQAFKATKESIKLVSEKAGEAAQITKLLIEKTSLEHRITKKFAKIGSLVYKKASNSGELIRFDQEDLKTLIDETAKLDRDLADLERRLDEEKTKKTDLKLKASDKPKKKSEAASIE
jgi:hypothetical protein